MNLPNKLTVMRICLVPILLVFLIFPLLNETATRIIAFVLFAVASYTDHLDGKIARERNLVTDFGKFLDPVADKLLIIGSLIGILCLNQRFGAPILLNRVIAASLFLVVFRELAITSLRMVIADKQSKVMAANSLGKIKTVTQIVCLLVLLAEPILLGRTPIGDRYLFSYLTLAAMALMTLISGIAYCKAYFPLLDPKK